MDMVFFGSSEFAVESLQRLLDRHTVRLVVTQPDRPRGRHLHLSETPVKRFSRSRGLEIFQPENMKAAAAVATVRKFPADVFVVISFGQILSQEVLDIPKHCCLNVHASLLPCWRGAAPINWALMSHDEKTGVSVMRMNERMDAGDVILQREVRIHEDHDAVTLGKELAVAGALAIEEALDRMARNVETYSPQDQSRVTIARKLRKADGHINWQDSNRHIHDQVRALIPWPGAFTHYKGTCLKVFRTVLAIGAALADQKPVPGTIIQADKQLGILVATGEGYLSVQEVQPEGGRRMSAYDFILGHKLEPGTKLG